MNFALRGIPIHTRTLAVTLRHESSAEVGFAGYVLDLRKRGFVPVAGDLQGPGILHHMEVHGAIDRPSLALGRVAARMPTVAVEATPASRGESCRDLMARVEALGGTPLDAGYARRAGAEIGGPLGCSHVLTLVQLLGPTARWALAEDARLLGADLARRPGERLFRRDIVVDAHASGKEVALFLQLNDLHLRPTAELARAPERFAAQLELRIAATLLFGEFRLTGLEIAERRRGAEDLETAPWVSRPDRAEPLCGISLRPGVTGEILRRFPSPDGDQPLLDGLLMLAPAAVQCFASFVDTWTMIPGARGEPFEGGGFPDSCYMWRRGGAFGTRGAVGSL